MPFAPDEQLAGMLAEIARQLRAEKTAEQTRAGVTGAAVRAIDGCDHASISLIHRDGRIVSVAATDDVPGRVDAIQYRTGEGPCVDAIAFEAVYQTGDLGREDRWAGFGPRAVEETGVRSMLACRLSTDTDPIGALNLYSRRPDAFDDHDRAVTAILAAHATIAIEAAEDREHAGRMESALDSNRRIGMAMGILMARRQMTEDAAFAALRRASQHLNTKLRDVAVTVVETGELPERRRPPTAGGR
jgi:GAF domain-containing protein